MAGRNRRKLDVKSVSLERLIELKAGKEIERNEQSERVKWQEKKDREKWQDKEGWREYKAT